jgi:hypothetical protein
MTLGAFVCLLAFLAIQQAVTYRENAPSALSYLMDSGNNMPDDPLGIASRDMELVGVSRNGMVVGYATESDIPQSMMTIDRAMRAKGWSVLEMNAQGISSYVRQGEDVSAPQSPALACTCVLFICTERNGGSSIVAELL